MDRYMKKQLKLAELKLAEYEVGSPQWLEALENVKKLRETTEKGDRVSADGKLAAGATVGVALIPILAKKFGLLAGDAGKYLPKLKWK